jgi:hypothetical protein
MVSLRCASDYGRDDLTGAARDLVAGHLVEAIDART